MLLRQAETPLQRLIRGLEAARGNGTSMISLIMGPRDQARWRRGLGAVSVSRPSSPCRRPARLRRSPIPPPLVDQRYDDGLDAAVRSPHRNRPQVSKIAKMLADEYGTASNIKSRVNRQACLRRWFDPTTAAACALPLTRYRCAVRAGRHHLRATAAEAVQQGTDG